MPDHKDFIVDVRLGNALEVVGDAMTELIMSYTKTRLTKSIQQKGDTEFTAMIGDKDSGFWCDIKDQGVGAGRHRKLMTRFVVYRDDFGFSGSIIDKIMEQTFN